MAVREVAKAVTRSVMQASLSEVERRWPVGGRLRDDVEEARGAAEDSDPQTIGRRSGLSVVGFARFADGANFAQRESFAMSASRAPST